MPINAPFRRPNRKYDFYILYPPKLNHDCFLEGHESRNAHGEVISARSQSEEFNLSGPIGSPFRDLVSRLIHNRNLGPGDDRAAIVKHNETNSSLRLLDLNQ